MYGLGQKPNYKNLFPTRRYMEMPKYLLDTLVEMLLTQMQMI
jgi:hypothetical protein